MKNYLLLISTFFFIVKSFAQCEINVSATSLQLTCGQSANLSAFGSSTGQVILNENFNGGGFGTGWGATPGATNFSNPCSPGGVDGTTHAWMDDNTSVPRTLTSAPYNLTAATAGVTICFDLLFAEQGDNSPCEGPDEPDEGVYLQYSIDGGATWVDIHYFDPNGGNDPQLTNWNNWCFTIPTAAITSNTLFRWHQTADSGADYDHWGIDNVQIFQNDINAEVEWLHDGYSYGIGSAGGVNPTPVTPITTTTYTAQITTGTGQVCTSSITIVVVDPVFEVTVSADPTNICVGECSSITGNAQVVLDPGGIETYENNEFDLVVTLPVANASVNVNVQGINTNAIYDGLIQNVTINGFSFGGVTLCTNFFGCNCNGASIGFGDECELDASSFTVTLTSPGGCEIVLAPAGVANGNYSDVVFVPVAGNPIGGGFPTGGPWNPNEPFSNLNGCDPNGVWTLSYDAPGLGFGGGVLDGWSITFDDPPIYAPVTATWSPTAGLSSTNTINTTACPTASTDYVLTLSNGTPGCATETVTVPIIVDPCGCVPPAVIINPLSTCEPNTVNLVNAIDPASDAATLSYHATQLNAQNDVSPIATTVGSSGPYWVRVEDPSDPTCFTVLEISVTISPLDNASFSFADFCAGSSNSATGIATPGGTFSFSPNPGDGATINATTGSITNGVNGSTYTILYTTSGACPNSSTESVSVTGFTYTATVVDDNCDSGIGEINLSTVGGSAPFNYSLNAGATQTNGSFTGLSSGNYTVLITDNNGCTATGTESVNNTGGPTIVSITPTNLTCSGTCDGEITVVVSGGNPPYSYQWFDGAGAPIGTDLPTITGLCADNYSVEVTDASGGSTLLNNNSDFDLPGAAPCDCPIDFSCNNDAGQVYDGISAVYAVGNNGCVTGSTGYSNSLGAHSGNGYVYFYAGADFISDGPFNFVGGETVELCVYYAGPQGAGPPGQNTANAHFSFGMDGVQIGPDVLVPTNTGWTEFCFSVVMTPGNHTFQILSGGAAQYAMWFDDFTITNVTGGGGTVCSSSANTVVTGAAASDATFSFTDFCEGTPNGAFDIVNAGGTFAFNPIPGDGSTINSVTGEISNEVAGTIYSVEYSIGGACPDTHVEQVVVNANPTPVIAGSLTYCPGGNVTLDAGAGYAAYNWTVGGVFWGAGGTAQTVTTTALNDISVSVTTVAGCIATSPSVDVVESSTITTNTNLTICEGGSIMIHGNLESTANTYTFTTTSVGGCDSTSNVTLTVNPLPEIDGLTVVNESCQGENDGSIAITSLSNQVGAITYSWDVLPDPGNVATVNDLPPGVYTVTISDAGTACVSDSAIALSAGPICCDITLNTTSLVQPSCNEDDGAIEVSANGGDGNYTYSMNGGVYDVNNIFQNLGAGNYEIVVQDGSGNCSDTIQVNLANPGAPAIVSLIGFDLNCNDDNSGAITVTANGGQGSISYEITLGSTTITSTTGQFSGLQAGNYTVIATDANGCEVSDNVMIAEPDEMILQILSTDIPCDDLTAGSITINVTNGVAPFQYSIDNGATWGASNSFVALSAQNYSIMVQDDNGCLVNGTASISEEVQPTADFIYNPLKLTVFDSDIFTYNYSANATDYYWEITGSLGYSFSYSTTEIEHVFPQDTGTYVICLTATNPTGCSDVLCKTIVVQEDITVYVPNAFTPDGNEFNQYFYPVVRGVDSQDYDFLIYDRWGELIFESNNVYIGWDGTYKGKIAQSGTYTWKIITKDPDIDNRRVFLGHVNLLR